MLSLLTECTILMLKVIHEMFREQQITYDEFLKLTEVKIQFLSENMDNILNDVERKNAGSILNKCTSLISRSSSHHMTDVYCFNSDIVQ